MGGASGGTGNGGAGDEGGGGADQTIRDRIGAHQRYPALARQRGVEGKVRLSLRVAPDGSVEVSVLRGADPMLDQAALDAVRAAVPLPPTRGWRTIELEYQLRSP